MAVTKRTRFEVLRRDNYTCRYCRSEDQNLTIDHVTPLALGGTDEPSNLVACCVDCNAGKSSTTPDSEVVEQVKEDTVRWSAAIKRAAEEADEHDREAEEGASWFAQVWREATFSGLPSDWERSIATFTASGLTVESMTSAVQRVQSKAFDLQPDDRFRYFCGICWARVRDIRARAEEILNEGEPNGA